jgi:ABC-type transport system substrate-binding protein
MVGQVAEQSYVKFTQNPNYWGRNLTEAQIAANPMLDPGHVKTVIVYAKLDDVARYTDLSTGAAQMVAIRTGDWNLIQSNPDKFSYLTLPAWSPLITAIPINTQTYPTNITDVRQAIVHAINYTDISQKAFFGQTSPWMGPEYPAWKDFYDLGNFTPYQYNITLAKQYLAKANVTKMPDLTFTIPAGCDWCTTVAVVVQVTSRRLASQST